MFAVPKLAPLTSPEPSTVATLVLLLLQVLPATSSDSVNVVMAPVQTDGVPPNAAGTGFTVTTAVAKAPHGLGIV